MSRFSTRIARGLDRVARSAMVPIIYGRPASGTAIAIDAVPGKTDFKSEEQLNVIAENRTRDYIVPSLSLTFAEVPFRPQRGDTVTEADGNVYEVSPPKGGQQPWRYCDAGQTHIRIHTRLKVAAK